jgi:Ras-related protein Rab-1A
VIGDEAVGKTCLIKRYTENIFPEHSYQTIGVDFSVKEMGLYDSRVKLQIWDFAGQKHYRSFQYTFCEGAEGAIIAFDLSDPRTLKNLDNWLLFLKDSLTKEIPTIIVGTKSDIKSNNLDWKKLLNFTRKNNLKYFETSAKENISIDPPFYYLSRIILENHNKITKAVLTN